MGANYMSYAGRLTLENARVMDRLYKQLCRTHLGSPAWIAAGIAFLREGLERGCLDNLNELGDALGPRCILSERCTDQLFENGLDTERFVAALREAAAADDFFEKQIRREFGDRILDRPLDLPQMALFA